MKSFITGCVTAAVAALTSPSTTQALEDSDRTTAEVVQQAVLAPATLIPPPPPQVPSINRISSGSVPATAGSVQHLVKVNSRGYGEEQDVYTSGHAGTGYGHDVMGVGPEFDPLIGWTGGAERILVIPLKAMDAKSQAALEEDLTVMSRILDKAVRRKGDGSAISAMNITIHSLGLPRQPKAIYLEGFGALFLNNVPFPLTPTAASSRNEDKESKPPSTWEQTRREVYGPAIPGWKLASQAHLTPSEPYDEPKVNQLKDTLLKTVKEASNIRQLKPDEWIVICLTGADPGAKGKTQTIRTAKKVVMTGEGGASVHISSPGEDQEVVAEVITLNDGRSPVSAQSSTLVLRARKADVDALAAQKMTADEFREKSSLMVY